MKEKTKDIITVIIGIVCIIGIIVMTVFIITSIIDTSKTQKEIDRQIGVDYSNYEVLETKNVKNGFIKYVTMKINDEWVIYKISKDGSNIIVELIK